jgi:subtilisin family serine protease
MVKVGKLFSIFLCLAFTVVLLVGQAEAQEPEFTEIRPAEIIGEHAPGQLLVKFKPGVPSSQVEEVGKNLGVSALKVIPRIGVRVMNIPEGKGVAEMINAFRKSPWVQYAEPNYRCYKTLTPDDTYYSGQWALSQTSDCDIDAPEGWDITTGSSSITIAVIDDGIDYNHEEFPSGKLWINTSTNMTGYDFAGTCTKCRPVDTGCIPDDDVMHESGSGHGTATAGIAAADTNNAKGIAGVSWGAVIMPLKVENSCGHIYHSYMADAIIFAVDNGAHIISMSVGGPSSSATLEDACRYAWENGRVIVVSSGNDNTEISYPARYPTTIAVGATNEIDNRIYPGNPGNEWAAPQGSNYGPELDVVAPGINIYSTDWSATGEGYSSGNYTATFGGTSASCPFVAGEAALLLAKDSSLSNERVRSIIRSSAEDQVGESSEDTPGFDIHYGYGRINLYNALSAPTKPDLTLTSSDITFSNDNPSPGETVNISATIHNNGINYSEISAINIGSQLNGADPATADSYQGTYYPENANDGDYSTGWASQYETGWVKIDLTEVKMIGRVYWHDTLFVSNNQPGDFTIKVSIDDVSYTTIDTVTGYTGNSYIKILGTPIQARYVKMEMTARTTGNAATLDELGVYEVYYDTVVRFYDGDPGSGGTQIGSDQHLPPVPASGTKSASVQWTAIAGSHDIYVVVDPDSSIPESNETNNKACKSVSVGPSEIISFTVTDYGNNGIQFGNLFQGATDQPADCGVSEGAITLTVGSETNVDIDVKIRGNNFSGPGTIGISNVKYDLDDDPTGAGILDTDYALWYSVAQPLADDDVKQSYYWITIPGSQTPGTYTSTFYFQAVKSP